MTNTQKSLERFDKKFTQQGYVDIAIWKEKGNLVRVKDLLNNIKHFFKQELEKAREDTLKEVKRIVVGAYEDEGTEDYEKMEHNDPLDYLMTRIKQLKERK